MTFTIIIRVDLLAILFTRQTHTGMRTGMRTHLSANDQERWKPKSTFAMFALERERKRESAREVHHMETK